MTPLDIAQYCHEANRGLCIAQGVLFHLQNPDASPSARRCSLAFVSREPHTRGFPRCPGELIDA